MPTVDGFKRYGVVMAVVALVLAGGLVLRQCQAQDAVAMSVETVRLQPAGTSAALSGTVTSAGTVVRVEVATTPAQHERGLMFRRSLGQDAGMLFVWPRAQVAKFWMRNTFIPLDMLFFRNGVLVDSVQWAQPHDETPLGPDEPVDMVLEVKGGYVAAHSIVPGWRLVRGGSQD